MCNYRRVVSRGANDALIKKLHITFKLEFCRTLVPRVHRYTLQIHKSICDAIQTNVSFTIPNMRLTLTITPPFHMTLLPRVEYCTQQFHFK